MAGSRSRSSSRDNSPMLTPDPYDPISQIEMDDYPRAERSPRPSSTRTISSPSVNRSSIDAGDPFRSASGASLNPEYTPRRSIAPSFTSLGPTSSRFRGDIATEMLVERRAKEIAKWHIHWVTPFLMALLFFAGLMGAIAHHLFYLSLDGKPAENQLWMVRYGTALAFWTKATLVGSVILSYRQRIWQTFRMKAMTMSAIDGLFAATEDPSMFIKWEMLRNAKLATFMALTSWLIPIAALLSPASLTTTITKTLNVTTCENVPNLNFAQEAGYDFRDVSMMDDRPLIYYNTTDVKAQTEGWFDYLDQPSKNTRRLVNTAVYLRRSIGPEHVGNICTSGWNCTYTIHVVAPGYNCQEIASGEDADEDQIKEAGAPLTMSMLAPRGDVIYWSDVDSGDYQRTQTNGTFIAQPYPDDLGVLKGEPVIWIGYAVNTSEPYGEDSKYAKKWKTVHIPKIFRCDHYVTDYTIDMNFTDGTQHALVSHRDFLRPVINTTMTRDGDSYNFAPESEFVRPNDKTRNYKAIAAYHALGSLLRNFLRGLIDSPNGYPVTYSDISETKLSNASTFYPVDELMRGVQDMYEDMVVTLMSETLVISHPISVECGRTRYASVFHYERQGLWVGYAIVIVITLIFLGIGGWSMWSNGVASDTLFSRILVTCRNPTLDRLSVGACLGSDPFPAELERTKLRFGVLLEDSEAEDGRFERLFGKVEHAAFGTVGETKPIVRYNTYAGLKKYRNELAKAEEAEELLSEKERLDEDEEEQSHG